MRKMEIRMDQALMSKNYQGLIKKMLKNKKL
jgi:hypothetical protein